MVDINSFFGDGNDDVLDKKTNQQRFELNALPPPPLNDDDDVINVNVPSMNTDNDFVNFQLGEFCSCVCRTCHS